MDAIVQFCRNALCTLKNFNILSDTFLYDPNVTARYYKFPPPLDQTTPLEVLISVTQFYAFVSVTLAGYRLFKKDGMDKLQLISRLVNARAKSSKDKDEKKKKENTDEDDKIKKSSETVAHRLVAESLLNEGDVATHAFFVGVDVFFIGISFFWLFANSYHVTATDWIGGVQALINALTVAEIGLIFLLYFMFKDAVKMVRKSFKMKEFASNISGTKSTDTIQNITVEQYSWLVDGWTPFWASGSSGKKEDIDAEAKMLTKEEESVAHQLAKAMKKVDADTAERIRAQSKVSLFEGYREYLYFIINFFAFYGYAVSILVYYFQDEKSQPEYIRALFLWLPNDHADWLGNALGDFMWTLEPIIILGSPLIAGSIAKQSLPKEKSD
eukprot:CAMPEP_0171328494 /NCGR_PEP_ID=MMETSP0878-20121228/688_1 /TAXON_ID=67004 /ORGANISM="Thalassiosira weissflogii, Strain CCMP1336" /LENGTH=383 /DNA_ID=CAMNT_0011828347 /DNA_START=17 /DNA_END=1168 /DNA_ORIENTATION=+